MKDLTKGKPISVILRFALPVFIGNLFNLAYNLADTRIIGSYLGDEALAAVGSVSTLSDLLVGFIVGLANGFAVLTAMQFGRGDKKAVTKYFALSLEFGVIIALIIALGSHFGLEGIFKWLNVGIESKLRAAAYINIIIYGLIFSAVYNVLAASLRAIGDAYTPLLFLIFSAVMNVILDIVCVGKLQLDVAGAAYATVISQVLAAVLCFIYALIRYEIFRFKWSDLKPSRSYVKQLLSSGFSMGLMNSLVAFGTLSLQTAINKLGPNIIVAHTGARKLTNIFMLPFSVFGTTMATYTGQNYGANRIDRIKAGLRVALLLNYIWVVIVQVVTWTIAPLLIRAITATSIQEVIDNAVLYQKFDTAFYVIPPTITILRNSLQGMGDHFTPVVSSGLELVGKILIAILLTPILKYWGIIIAEPIVWALMVIPLIISMVKRLKKC